MLGDDRPQTPRPMAPGRARARRLSATPSKVSPPPPPYARDATPPLSAPGALIDVFGPRAELRDLLARADQTLRERETGAIPPPRGLQA
jgi:hypothetical protein